MNNKNTEISTWNTFIRVRELFKKIQQMSYIIAKTENRYPALESLTAKELDDLTKIYLSMGFDLEEIFKDWKKLYKKYKNEQET